MSQMDADKKLKEDNKRIIREGLPMIEVAKQQVISECKKSPEHTEDIVCQFGEGYQDAKARMRERMCAAGLDPKVLDSFDEENEAEEPLHLLNYLL